MSQPNDARALAVSLSFPQGSYAGATLGEPDALPSPARVHEAFVAAAAGGPSAEPDGRVLVASGLHRAAVEWLERNRPLGIRAPEYRLTAPTARRYRWRGSPLRTVSTEFESPSSIAGPVVYLWPAPDSKIVRALQEIAAEVTHVGRADSVVIARVETIDHDDDELLTPARGRGPGHVMRIPLPGRLEALAKAHREACKPGGYGAGPKGQAPDYYASGNNPDATDLWRFAESPSMDWPYREVWVMPVTGCQPGLAELRRLESRVGTSVGVHRAIVAAIGADVPAFVSGRSADGPLRGAGHLAIHIHATSGDRLEVLICIPSGTGEADIDRLAEALGGGLRAGAQIGRYRTRWFDFAGPEIRSATRYWKHGARLQRTAVPLVVEALSGPRGEEWTLDDAVTCSVGYALRGVLERSGFEWTAGRAFRRRLVDALRNEYGAGVRAERVRGPAGQYVHRAGERELVVAANAVVDLGSLAPPGGSGFLAIGRARHLGGGLLVPHSDTNAR